MDRRKPKAQEFLKTVLTNEAALVAITVLFSLRPVHESSDTAIQGTA